MANDERIRIHLTGSRTGVGSIEFDALLAFGDHFRRALRAIAREGQGNEPALSGHPTHADEQASSLRIVGLSEGSAVLELEPTRSELFPAVESTMEQLGRAMADGDMSATVHRELLLAARSLGREGSVRVDPARSRGVSFDEARLAGISPRQDRPEKQQPPHVDGWLHAVDLVPAEIRVRDATGIDWVCRFPDEMQAAVSGFLGRQVRVVGAGTTAGGRAIEVTSILDIVADIAGSLTPRLTADALIEQAMVAAGVTGAQLSEALRIDLDEDDPEVAAFFEAIS